MEEYYIVSSQPENCSCLIIVTNVISILTLSKWILFFSRNGNMQVGLSHPDNMVII